ncbi:MAG: hypothetical protein ABIE74_04975 [Pseudomonadota bacterium]
MRLFKVMFVFVVLAGFCVGCSGGDKPSMQGSKSDMGDFLKDYENFVVDYCADGEKFKSASMSEKMAFSQKMMKHAEKMTEYNALLMGFKSSEDDAAKKKLEKLEAKLEKCSAYYEM